MNQHMPWSEKDLQKLKRIYPYYHGEWERLLKALPNRTKRAISRMANKTGIKRLKRPKPWLSVEIKHLRRRRMKLGIPLIKLSFTSGYEAHEINQWERGKRQPNEFQIQCIKDSLERLAAE